MLPEKLILRLRTPAHRTIEDETAERLIRGLIEEYGKDPEKVLQVMSIADWPSSDDPSGFKFPQLFVYTYWKGLPSIELYVKEMSEALPFFKEMGVA